MNCFVHARAPAVGLCAVCQKAVCRDCVGRDTPRIICRTCIEQRTIVGYEYRSSLAIGGWPLVHVAAGFDPVTMRPRVARGVIAIGNLAVGVVAIAGLSCGLVAVGGLSIGILLALGGVALGLGLSAGGLAVGSIAVGGMAVGLAHAIGGVAVAPSIIDGRQCHPDTAELVRRWLGSGTLPPPCR
jgi:hypothetical protein